MFRLLAVVALLAAACRSPNAGDAPTGPPVTLAAAGAAPVGDAFEPPLAGHRLAVLGDVAIVADPQGPGDDGTRPQVHLVSLSDGTVLASLALPSGAKPEAVVVTSDHNVYVVAAGLGGVYSVDVSRRALGPFAPVCAAPVDAAARGADLIVACRSGELVTLTASGPKVRQLYAPLSRVAVDDQGNVFVALQSAQVLEMDTPVSGSPVTVALDADHQLAPNTPRRLVALPGGGAVMLYQQSLTGELTTVASGEATPMANASDESLYSGSDSASPDMTGCALPAARPALTAILPRGGFMGQLWAPVTLAVDAAVDESGLTLALADPANDRVLLLDATTLSSSVDDACLSSIDGVSAETTAGLTSPFALAWWKRSLVVLGGGANLTLTVVRRARSQTPQTIALRPRTPSLGFALFHSNPRRLAGEATGLTVACASCHPDGLSTGAVLTIDGQPHRVMTVAEHTRGATLMHWDGLPFHDAIAEKTWHVGMGGEPLLAGEQAALRAYLDQLKLPPRPPADPRAVGLGSAAFDKAGCSSCHTRNGRFSNDGIADVGHGQHKVPSLLGLAYTAPYMSDGCAATLEARFDDPQCGGGVRHGNLAALSPLEQEQLTAYLKSL
jgi:hypothetical protein